MINEPIPYARLYELAQKMHCWIFLHTGNEEKVYDELGLTERENVVLGYSGTFTVEVDQKEASV